MNALEKSRKARMLVIILPYMILPLLSHLDHPANLAAHFKKRRGQVAAADQNSIELICLWRTQRSAGIPQILWSRLSMAIWKGLCGIGSEMNGSFA